jgi:hypothetical protein
VTAYVSTTRGPPLSGACVVVEGMRETMVNESRDADVEPRRTEAAERRNEWEIPGPVGGSRQRRQARRPPENAALSAHWGERAIELLDVSESGIGLLAPLLTDAESPVRAFDTLVLELREAEVPIGRLTLRVAHAARVGERIHIGGLVERLDVVPTGRAPLPEAGDILEISDAGLERKIMQRVAAQPRAVTLELGSGEHVRGMLEGGPGEPNLFAFHGAAEAALEPLASGPVSLAVSLHDSDFLLDGRLDVAAGGECSIELSRVLSLSRRRHERVRMPPGVAWLEWTDPLLPSRHITAEVIDLTPRGAAVRLSASQRVLFPAPPVALTLRIGDQAIRVTGEVQNYRELVDGRVIGLALTPVTPLAGGRLTAFCRQHRFPSLRDRSQVASSDVLHLMRASGYLQLRDGTELTPGAAWQAGTGDGGLAENIVFQSNSGSLLGHMSCLRVYETSFLLQELATVGLRRGKIAYPLYMRHLEWVASQVNDSGYLLAYFNQQKSWHEALFGDFVRWAGSEGLSLIVDLERLEAHVDCPVESGPARVRAALVEELAYVAKLARSQLPSLYADGIALDAEKLARRELCESYGRLGLERSRTVLVVELDGRVVGAALCDTGPCDLSLFNLLNLAHVFVLDGLRPAQARAAQRALLARVREFYAERCIKDPLVVSPKGRMRFASDAGLHIAETMGGWIVSLGGLRQWRNFMHFTVGGLGEPRRHRELKAS